MDRPVTTLIAALAATSLLGACSSDSNLFGSNLTTSSVNSATPPVQVVQNPVPRVDPACVSLSARIDALRRDGVTERVEKASIGKSANVSVKRASLAQMTELDKANAEFQAKCSTLGPRPMPVQAQVAPAPTTPPIVTARAPMPSSTAPPPVVTQAAPKQ